MRTAFETNTWYCHAFCKIPKVQLIQILNDLENNGGIEEEMIRLAENAPIVSTTHRQLVNDGKKKTNTYSLNPSGKAKDLQYKVDLSSSEGQVKCNGQLSQIFNLLD